MPSPATVAENDPQWIREKREQREKEQAEQKREQQQQLADAKKRWKADYAAAKKDLKEAKEALAEGKVIVDGDYTGNAGGGARPSASYLARVAGLEAELAEAKAALKKLKRSRP